MSQAQPDVPALVVQRERIIPAGPLDLVRLIRPRQWVKNFLVVPLPFLDPRTWSVASARRVGVAVAMFVLASAIVYIVNDIGDRHRDLLHPVKRHRPVASGRVPVWGAWWYCASLTAVLVVIMLRVPAVWSWPVPAYLALNLTYSRVLKHLPLFDVLTVAVGFVLRLLQGYLAAGRPVSGWLATCVFTACLLLSLGRRRHELRVGRVEHRPALAGYPAHFVDHLLMLVATVTVMSFLSYVRTEAPIAPYALPATLLLTPVALLILFRYLQIVLVDGGGGDPVRILLRDRLMVGAGVLGAGVFAGTVVAGWAR